MKKNEGVKLIAEIKEKQKEDRKAKRKQSPIVQAIHGIWMFAEGVSLLVTSLFAIYQAHFGSMPEWGKYILTVAGVLVLVPAAILLAKFFRRVGQE